MFTSTHTASACTAVAKTSRLPTFVAIGKDKGENWGASAVRVLAVSSTRLGGVVGERCWAGKEAKGLASRSRAGTVGTGASSTVTFCPIRLRFTWWTDGRRSRAGGSCRASRAGFALNVNLGEGAVGAATNAFRWRARR